MAYIAEADLWNALGKPLIVAIFDDNNDGIAEPAAIASCLAYASAEVDAFLVGTYDVTLPLTTVPDVVKFAAIDFACAYATRRRPDIVRAMGEESWTTFRDAAVDKMKLYARSFERLPETIAKPANVGGVSLSTTNNIIGDSGSGTPDFGAF